MRGLCGWFAATPRGDHAEIVGHMLAGQPSATESVVTKNEPCCGVAAFGSSAAPQIGEADDVVVIVAGHARVRDGAHPGATPAVVARMLRDQWHAALGGIAGDFALAAWDRRTRRGLLAIDRIGIQTLSYQKHAMALAFGSNLDVVTGFPGSGRRLSDQAIYDYLYFHVVPGPATVYVGVQRLQPGHYLEFHPDRGLEEPRPYWRLDFAEERVQDLGALKTQFFSILRDSVATAAEERACGSFLSGGTDSSTVSGMLGQVAQQPAQTFSIGFDVPGYDETSYARIAAKHFRTDHHEYYVTPKDVVQAVPRIAAAYDQPFGNASAIPTYYCARMAAEHGIGRLLAGDGGDELFGGNERYAKQHLLSLYGSLPSWARAGVIEPLLLGSALTKRLPLVRKLRSYVEQARPAMPWRYESYNLLMHLGAATVLTPAFASAVNLAHPRQLLGDAHAPYAQCSLINQMLGIDLRFILADGDLPKVTHMCNLAGIDVVFPLLDDRVIDFSQRLPSDLKLRGTKLRWFFKHALLDFLPGEIITKQKHGFGLPVGQWLIEHRPLFELAMDSIQTLKPRGIVDTKFVDDLVGIRLREHPGYYGTMVWLLMMLGLWLGSRKL